MNQENGHIGSQTPGTQPLSGQSLGGDETRTRERVRGRVKTASESAAEAARVGRERAAEWAKARSNEASEWARTRGTQASDWARERLAVVQGRVEADPQRATLWALGAGFVFGILVASLLRGSRSSDFE
jgi:hypothetical protein